MELDDEELMSGERKGDRMWLSGSVLTVQIGRWRDEVQAEEGDPLRPAWRGNGASQGRITARTESSISSLRHHSVR